MEVSWGIEENLYGEIRKWWKTQHLMTLFTYYLQCLSNNMKIACE